MLTGILEYYNSLEYNNSKQLNYKILIMK